MCALTHAHTHTQTHTYTHTYTFAPISRSQRVQLSKCMPNVFPANSSCDRHGKACVGLLLEPCFPCQSVIHMSIWNCWHQAQPSYFNCEKAPILGCAWHCLKPSNSNVLILLLWLNTSLASIKTPSCISVSEGVNLNLFWPLGCSVLV